MECIIHCKSQKKENLISVTSIIKERIDNTKAKHETNSMEPSHQIQCATVTEVLIPGKHVIHKSSYDRFTHILRRELTKIHQLVGIIFIQNP